MDDFAKLERFVRTIEIPLGPRWPHRGRPPRVWARWRAAQTAAERFKVYTNSGLMQEHELRLFCGLYLEYLVEARRLWRVWLKVKPTFDRRRRDVN